MQINEWMTTEEVAVLLRCTPRTLWNWRKAGQLPASRVGKRWLYRRSDVLQRLETADTAHLAKSTYCTANIKVAPMLSPG